MHSVVELVASVDAAFVETGRGLTGWEDPHPDRRPLDEEYSRVTNPQKYRILRARAEAWLKALATAGLAEVEQDIDVDWEERPRVDVVSVRRALPRAFGAIPIVFAWTRFDEAFGVVIGVGDPTVVIEVIPDCGCDACDSGSQDVLDLLDEYVLGVVTGEYRRLRRGNREITVYSQDHQGSSGFRSPWENIGRLVPGRLKGEPLAASVDSLYSTTTDNIGPEGAFRRSARGVRIINDRPRRLFRLPRAIARKFAWHRYHRQLEKALAHPKGWHEVRGSSWLDGDNPQ